MNAHLANHPSVPNRLTVFYDGHCLFCRRVASWLQSVELRIPLDFLDLCATETEKRFPELCGGFAAGRFIVLADDGRLYFDTKGRLMVLYATVKYRELSYRLAAPLFFPTVDTVLSGIAAQRTRISWAGLVFAGLKGPRYVDCNKGACSR